MGIVQRVNDELQVGLEGILIRVVTISDILLDLLQALKHVDGGLLVALRGVLEIGERALELERRIIIVDEASGHGRVERHARQAFVHV